MFIAYNATCGESYSSSHDKTRCSEEVGLACVDGRCQCRFELSGGQRWNPEMQVCASLEGYRYNCELMNDGGNILCDDGLECISSFGPLKGYCQKSSNQPNQIEPISSSAVVLRNNTIDVFLLLVIGWLSIHTWFIYRNKNYSVVCCISCDSYKNKIIDRWIICRWS